MSFNARVFRILIASPSDVEEEREIAVNTIQAWNDLHSASRNIVLLPLRWETHSAPEYDKRPQEIINRQIVDDCDLVVGVFWTRIGTPTGLADSGTIEEIERASAKGKTVMLYFSRARQNPDDIDLDQLKKLREFKSRTQPKALVENFSGQIEFRDKLSKQLEIQLRTLLVQENIDADDKGGTPPKTEVQFQFANLKTGKPVGAKIALHSQIISVPDFTELPDYEDLDAPKKKAGDIFSFDRTNKEFYRELTNHIVAINYFKPIRFFLCNDGGLGARDVYVDLRISSDKKVRVKSAAEPEFYRPRPSGIGDYNFWSRQEEIFLERDGNDWISRLELSAMQPKRTLSPPPTLWIGAHPGSTVTIAARFYADTLAEPILRTLEIETRVDQIEKSAFDLLKEELPEFNPSTKPEAKRIAKGS